MEAPQKSSQAKTSPFVWVGVTAAVLIVGFFAGIMYLKSSSASQNENQMGSGTMQSGGRQLMGGPGGGGGGACPNGGPRAMLMLGGQQVQTCSRPILTTVTSVGDGTVTATNDSGESVTFTVNDTTQIFQEGGTATLSDIKVDDELLVIPSDDDETVASYLIINPPQQGAN